MKKQWIIACLIGIQGVNVQAQQPSKYPYQDTKLTAEQRADDLLQRLTLEEKVALMQNNSPAIPRLGIKPYEWWNEALHGVARAGLATVFPQAIGMAASFNDELLYEVFDAVSDEARAKNRQFNEKGQYKRYQGLTMWTPNVNIVVAGPCWWGTYPMAVFTQLKALDFQGKKVFPLMTHEGSGLGGSAAALKKYCPGAVVGEGLAIHGAETVASEGTIKDWAKRNL